jgi:hypothetical protein
VLSLSLITADEKFQSSFTKMMLWLLKLIKNVDVQLCHTLKKTINMNSGNKHTFGFKIRTDSPHLYGYVCNNIQSQKILFETCDLLGSYTVSSGNLLSTFRDNLSVRYSGLKNLRILLNS